MTNQSSWEVGMVDVYDAPPLAFGTYTERLRSVLNGLKRIEHPGVLKMFDVGMLPDGRPYVVREMLSGTQLADLMPNKRPPLGESLHILREVCDVLIAAHDAGVVHRAVALDTVFLVGETKAVKLTDWGIGEMIADEVARRQKLGTLDVARRPVLTKKQDVYAVGVMMHQLLGEIPQVLGELWSAMMAQEVAKRPTMHEVAKQLANWNKRDRKPTTPPVRVSAEQPAPVGAVSGSMATTTPPRSYWRHAATALGCAAVPLLFLLVGSKLRIDPPPRATPVEITVAPTEEPITVAARMAPMQRRSEPRPAMETPRPAIAVAVSAPIETPAPVVKPAIPKARVAVDKPKPTPEAPAQIDYTLMNDYQRVGRALLLLEREIGPEAVASLKQQFKRIHIGRAMANVYTRQSAAVKLVELQRSIDSAQAAYRSK